MAVTWRKLAYEDDVMLNSVADANSLLYSVDDNTPAALAMAASTIAARLAAGNIVAATPTEIRTLLSVAENATSNAKATGAELDTGTDDDKFATAKALKDSHNVPSVAPGDDGNVLASNGTDWVSEAPGAPAAHKDLHDPEDGSDKLDTAAPAELAAVQASGVGSSHSFARADHAHQIQAAITDDHLVTVDDAAAADGEIAVFTATGIEGQTPAVVAATMALDDVGVPDAAVDFNDQQATDLIVHNVADEAGRLGLDPVIGKMVFQVDTLAFYGCTVAV